MRIKTIKSLEWWFYNNDYGSKWGFPSLAADIMGRSARIGNSLEALCSQLKRQLEDGFQWK